MNDDELLARLASADPAASLPAAAPERVARLLEDTMSHDVETRPLTESRATGTRARSSLTWSLAAAAVLVIIGGAVGISQTRDARTQDPAVADPGPTVTELTAPAAGDARCSVPTARLLGNAEVAFDGTVESVDDGVVTLVPTEFYAGDETDLVTVEAPSEGLQALLTSVEFRPGGRYLVAASPAGQVMVCGMSGTWSPGLADLYAEAFDG